MKAIIPAAGYGTRMYPLTLDKPKALLKIRNKQIIEYIINKIIEIKDIDEVLIITNNRFYLQFLKWKEDFICDVPIKIINDNTNNNEDRLGTLGDVNLVIKRENIFDDIIIINSDNLFTFNLSDIHSFFMKYLNSIVLRKVENLEEAKNYGNVKINNKNKIIDFVEKPSKPQSTICSTGIYLFSKEIIKLIKDYLAEGNSSDKMGDFISWLYKKIDIYGYMINEEKWFDIGDIESYEKAKREFKIF